MPRLAGLVVLVLLAAGCTAPPEEPVAPQTAPAPEAPCADCIPVENVTEVPAPSAPEPRIVVLNFNGSIVAAGYVTLQERMALPVEANATAVLAELAWDDPVQDLDLAVWAGPEGNETFVADSGGLPGSGDSPIAFVIDDPELLARIGEWHVGVNGKLAVDTPFRGAVSVFYHMPVPDGYTGLGP